MSNLIKHEENAEGRFGALNNAICYWLGYQYKIGREKLIHEASLRYPIADFLTGQGTEINKIQLEKGHPCFTDRPVDLLVYDKPAEKVTSENFEDSINEMYELKLAKSGTNTQYGKENQRVVDDILRLAFFNKISKKDSYFIICGTYSNFKNYFIGDKTEYKKAENLDENEIKIKMRTSSEQEDEWNTSKSLYNPYFEFRINGKQQYSFMLNKDLLELSKDELKQFKADYFGLTSFKKRYYNHNNSILIDSIKIKTTCVSITPFELKTFRTHACGIWKIECQK